MFKRILFLLPFLPVLLAGQCMNAFFYGTDEEFAEAKRQGAGGMTRINPPSLNFEVPPPPIANAQVTMTNSQGEVVLEGVTNASGVAEGNPGPGRMDHELKVRVVTPDGAELTQIFIIPTGWALVAIHVHRSTGEFVPEWRKPPQLRNRESDSEAEEHDR